jgi:hypothetical protein
MVLPGHIVVSDKIAPIGTLGAIEHGAAPGNREIWSARSPHTRENAGERYELRAKTRAELMGAYVLRLRTRSCSALDRTLAGGRQSDADRQPLRRDVECN